MRIKLSIKNALILICIVYTVLTVTSSGLALLQGQTTERLFLVIGIITVSYFMNTGPIIAYEVF